MARSRRPRGDVSGRVTIASASAFVSGSGRLRPSRGSGTVRPGVGPAALAGAVLEERAHGRHTPAHRRRGEAAVAQGDGVVVEHADRDRVGIGVLDEVAEVDQIAPVGLDGMRRRPPLQLEVGQEVA